jgi:cleavage and polyadenylation specificity factor subunit 3
MPADMQAIGSIAESRPEHGTPLKGLLVAKDFSYTLLDPKDLQEFTGLTTSVITQRQTIPISVDWSVVQWYLEGMYGEAEDGVDGEGRKTLTVSLGPVHSIT